MRLLLLILLTNSIASISAMALETKSIDTSILAQIEVTEDLYLPARHTLKNITDGDGDETNCTFEPLDSNLDFKFSAGDRLDLLTPNPGFLRANLFYNSVEVRSVQLNQVIGSISCVYSLAYTDSRFEGVDLNGKVYYSEHKANTPYRNMHADEVNVEFLAEIFAAKVIEK